MAHGQRHGAGLSAGDERLGCGFPFVGVRRIAAAQLAHFAQVRLDEIDTFGHRGRERRSRCVENKARAALPRNSRDPRIEIQRDAFRQAAACDHKARKRLDCRNEAQAVLPFRRTEVRTRQNEPVLLAGRNLIDEEVLPRFAGNRPGLADDTFLIEQLPQQASDRAADRIDRVRIAAEPPDHPRHIDPAAAGIAALRFAAKLGHGLDAVDRCRKIHGRIERDGDDIGHAAGRLVRTADKSALMTPTRWRSRKNSNFRPTV